MHEPASHLSSMTIVPCMPHFEDRMFSVRGAFGILTRGDKQLFSNFRGASLFKLQGEHENFNVCTCAADCSVVA